MGERDREKDGASHGHRLQHVGTKRVNDTRKGEGDEGMKRREEERRGEEEGLWKVTSRKDKGN